MLFESAISEVICLNIFCSATNRCDKMPEGKFGKYSYELIKPEEKDKLLRGLSQRYLHDRKASIHGMCIELLTDSNEFKEMWEDNFFHINDEVRPHGRIVAVRNENPEVRVLYEPASKTCFIINADYYGWVKSFALGVAADFLEEYVSIHSRFSVHGSCIDFSGRGIALIATSGAGKTTHSFGLLLTDNSKMVTYDWFFVKLTKDDVVAYGSEKQSYITDDIGTFWKVFEPLVKKTKLDTKGRGVANIEDVLGAYKKRSQTVIKKTVLIKRDPTDSVILRKISVDEAIDYLVKNNFCNPYQMVKDERKLALRTEFFRRMLSSTEVYLFNTHESIEKTHEEIRKIVKDL